MALYAFDGTWNSDKKGAEKDTNVRWFTQAYTDPVVYHAGVGTRFRLFGKITGGITGAGGRTRIAEAKAELLRNIEDGDTTVDIIGFSRGAALAIHFANVVERLEQEVRFLGIWDCVPSFGLPGNSVNLGWHLDLPDNVVKCYHALSLDERRRTFPEHRLSARVAESAQEGRLFEVWFRGAHSDVGGGNGNAGISSIPLNWILKKAISCGLPIDAARVQENAARIDPTCDCADSQWYDLIKNKFRVVRWNDQAHHTVSFRDDPKRYNNPPAGLCLVDDDGTQVGEFQTT
jgi:uncharacterized protein (DUF2235 family)